MGRQQDLDPIIDVEPLGMVIGTLGKECHSAHETERFNKVSKA